MDEAQTEARKALLEAIKAAADKATENPPADPATLKTLAEAYSSIVK